MTRFRKVSSYRGLTIESAHQRKTGVKYEVNPHLRRAHRVHYYWPSSSVLYSFHRKTGPRSILRGLVFRLWSLVFHYFAARIPSYS